MPQITEDEFIARFKPETAADGSYYRQRNPHDPADLAAIRAAQAEGRLWTAVEGDEGQWCCSSGSHAVNHLYNIITEVPVPPDEQYDISDDDDSFDSEEPDAQWNIPSEEFVAVYRGRSDGDYDFVVAFGRENLPQLGPGNVLEEMLEMFCGQIEDDGDEALIVESGDPDFPCVWSPSETSQPRQSVCVLATDLQQVVDHFLPDEERHYEEMCREGPEPTEHIFLDLQRLNYQLRNQTEVSPEPPDQNEETKTDRHG